MDAYESLGAIGEGTYGVVIRARHKATGQIVAIKRFKESEEDEQTRKTSLREVRVLKQLRHDNVVGLLDVFRRKGKLHIVFEYIDKTILEVLDATPRGIDPLTVKKYMYQLLKGLEFCHSQNIVHRDVKPENILISERGTLKICDFGFARPMTSGGKYTDYVATRWYRSPELLVGDVEYGKGVDIWALGCIFSEISTGQPLFPGESDYDQLAHILRCCGKLPQRFVQIFYKNPLYKNVDLPQQRVTESLDDRFRHPPSSGWLPFIKSCLRCDPAERESCTGLLASPYFEDSSDFSPAKYEAYIQTVYEKEQQLRAQLMAVSPPPPVPQQQQQQQLPLSQPTSQQQHGAGQAHANSFLPDLGRQGSAKPSETNLPPPPQQPHQVDSMRESSTVAQAPGTKGQSTLWSQYLASASHELPELGAKTPLGMPALSGSEKAAQPFVMKTNTSKLPSSLASMPSLQTGTAYRLPTLEGSQQVGLGGLSGVSKAPTPTVASSSMKVKDSNARTSLTESNVVPSKSPTPPNSLSVVGQGGKTSPSPTALSSQLAYKKKPQKKSVLTALNFNSYEGNPSNVGPSLVIGQVKHSNGLNSGLDPFGGNSLFAPNGTASGLPRGLPGTYPSNANPYTTQHERRGSNPSNQSPPVNHLYATGGNEGKLSDLIMKGRTSQQNQSQLRK